MEAVLISIQPKWCELIASGKKTVEVRKTKPKLETPFKCYIYCTEKDYDKIFCIDKFMHKVFLDGKGKQKIIGEFVCNLMTSFKAMGEVQALYNEAKETCISHDEIIKYANGKRLYYWHISDLKIYDTPKALSEFYQYCKGECTGCKYLEWIEMYGSDACMRKRIKRPPQSWCYVEQLENEYSGGHHE